MVEALRDQYITASQAGRHAEAAELHRQMTEIALRLNPETGHVASPAAVCALARCPRQTYDDAIRRFGGPNAKRQPRKHSAMAYLVDALRQSGDVRFAGPQAPPAAQAAAKELAGA